MNLMLMMMKVKMKMNQTQEKAIISVNDLTKGLLEGAPEADIREVIKKIAGEKLKPVFGWFVLIMGIYIILKELL